MGVIPVSCVFFKNDIINQCVLSLLNYNDKSLTFGWYRTAGERGRKASRSHF